MLFRSCVTFILLKILLVFYVCWYNGSQWEQYWLTPKILCFTEEIVPGLGQVINNEIFFLFEWTIPLTYYRQTCLFGVNDNEIYMSLTAGAVEAGKHWL